MNIEVYRDYCMAKKGVTEEFPFGGDTLAFKVKGKVFALTSADTFRQVNLKCDPEKAVELREQYEAVIPGYHMNKKHWNTVVFDGSISDKLLRELTDDSYNLVVSGLSKTAKATLDR